MGFRDPTAEEADATAAAQAVVDGITPGTGMEIRSVHISDDGVHIHLTRITDALKPGGYDVISCRKDVGHALRHVLPSHAHRQRRLHAMGVPGDGAGHLIETPLALFLARHYPREALSLIDRACSGEYRHDNTRTRPRFSASIREGIVRGSFELASGVRWDRGEIAIDRPGVPETVLRGLAGSPVKVLAEHALLPGDMTVRGVRIGSDGGVAVRMAPPTRSYEDIVRGTEAGHQLALARWNERAWRAGDRSVRLRPRRSDTIMAPGDRTPE